MGRGFVRKHEIEFGELVQAPKKFQELFSPKSRRLPKFCSSKYFFTLTSPMNASEKNGKADLFKYHFGHGGDHTRFVSYTEIFENNFP